MFKYNAHKAPVPIQFLIYFFIGGTAGVFNLVVFLTLLKLPQFDINYAVISAFVAAAALNYLLCIVLLFRHNAKWNSFLEILIYILVVVFGGLIDLYSVKFLVGVGISNLYAKVIASIVLIIANYWMRRALVFPEKNIPKRD
ncbi:MAG: GtrA family protein [Deltaproteobacteria bacterium]|nr:GtrA family protein [Deltaproteobacteria bacterium]